MLRAAALLSPDAKTHVPFPAPLAGVLRKDRRFVVETVGLDPSVELSRLAPLSARFLSA